MGRRLVLDEGLGPEQQLAELIIDSQLRAVGDLAHTLAAQVRGLHLSPGASPEVHGDPVIVLDALVCEYAAISGAIGPRLCFEAARPVLAKHPHLMLPSFQGLALAEPEPAEARPRRRLFGR